jgi:hypothetical protein
MCKVYLSINPAVNEYRNQFDRLGDVSCILETVPQNARLEYGNIKWVNSNEKQGWEKCICFHFCFDFWPVLDKCTKE